MCVALRQNQTTCIEGFEMKESTEDMAKGKFHEVKGAIKKEAGKATDNADLQADGTVEELGGKLQRGIGKVEKKFGH
jgi:uncharacterized protein YjbJ (UPF0337 family)